MYMCACMCVCVELNIFALRFPTGGNWYSYFLCFFAKKKKQKKITTRGLLSALCACTCVCVCENSIIIIVIIIEAGNIVVHTFLLLTHQASPAPTPAASSCPALSHHLCILFTGCFGLFICFSCCFFNIFIAAEKRNAKNELQMAGKFLIDHQINVSNCSSQKKKQKKKSIFQIHVKCKANTVWVAFTLSLSAYLCLCVCVCITGAKNIYIHIYKWNWQPFMLTLCFSFSLYYSIFLGGKIGYKIKS